MPLNYQNLDEQVRGFMLSEIERDINAGVLYISPNLNPQGQSEYADLLKHAATGGSDVSLAGELQGRLNAYGKPRLLSSGSYSKPPIMRSDAHEMLADGEFNRFYIRGVCLKALESGGTNVVVYRAKDSLNPRRESEEKIGQEVSAQKLLDDLRSNIGVDTALGLPAGPNSGLSVRLKQ